MGSGALCVIWPISKAKGSQSQLIPLHAASCLTTASHYGRKSSFFLCLWAAFCGCLLDHRAVFRVSGLSVHDEQLDP
jgi:hypothetical protein